MRFFSKKVLFIIFILEGQTLSMIINKETHKQRTFKLLGREIPYARVLRVIHPLLYYLILIYY